MDTEKNENNENVDIEKRNTLSTTARRIRSISYIVLR